MLSRKMVLRSGWGVVAVLAVAAIPAMLPMGGTPIAVAVSAAEPTGDSEAQTARFATRGIVLDVHDLSTVDWPQLAKQAGLNTIGTHITPSQVAEFIQSDAGQRFLASCQEHGIEVEHELHAIGDLLPRSLFDQSPELFRMDEHGQRVREFNLCVHSPQAIEIVCQNAVRYAKLLPSTTGRYFFWIDDGVPMCQCPQCREYSDSEQALILENAIVAALRSDVDPQATLAHLAYHNTLAAPVKVKPADGIFLEFAPFHRRWDVSLKQPQAIREEFQISHGEYLQRLDENLKVFPADTAQVLEYWLDVSLFSSWKKPAVQLPWNQQVFLDDLEIYASRGIRHVTSFGVYLDADYFKAFPGGEFLQQYGDGLNR